MGNIISCNSIPGSVANQGSRLAFAYNATTGKLLVGLPVANRVVIGTGAPAVPTCAANRRAGTAITLANLAATGTAIKWYPAPTGGTALPTTTPLTGGSTYYATLASPAAVRVGVHGPAPDGGVSQSTGR